MLASRTAIVSDSLGWHVLERGVGRCSRGLEKRMSEGNGTEQSSLMG